MWFPIERSELAFTGQSPFHLEHEATIACSPRRLFDIVSTGEGQREWFQDFVACRWTSDAPHGVGSTREIELRMLTVKERFLAWEPGRRLAFSIDAITIPLARQMLEDFQLAPAGEGSTRLLWRVHYAPSRAMRVVHPLARALFGRMFRASLAGLRAYAERT